MCVIDLTHTRTHGLKGSSSRRDKGRRATRARARVLSPSDLKRTGCMAMPWTGVDRGGLVEAPGTYTSRVRAVRQRIGGADASYNIKCSSVVLSDTQLRAQRGPKPERARGYTVPRAHAASPNVGARTTHPRSAHRRPVRCRATRSRVETRVPTAQFSLAVAPSALALQLYARTHARTTAPIPVRIGFLHTCVPRRGAALRDA